ncbi:hypothetical protein K437DRAFT_171078 [Tilletiaria anomala UBC 951]|uniref:RPAP1/MINIYO-like TPR repeats domain-containing protein n=1 Tax=Tilletiaria anomala (strain ATCC 24038 / CBS 436.72 / UBC 951) TaxID=1037660 RepID=A0A066VIU6_TILAU|nr:uncharacterized protein K437DRAFT_171078 [Tilletiaria anomala UBC 951]KDN41667.1 hypothetical protein K437DRAFT_171078 [Tilletiaria anomala UBC 951]
MASLNRTDGSISRQKVRPSWSELASFDLPDEAEYSGSHPQDDDGSSDPYLRAAMRRAALNGAGQEEDSDIEWRPAAHVVRGKPPRVGSSRDKDHRKETAALSSTPKAAQNVSKFAQVSPMTENQNGPQESTPSNCSGPSPSLIGFVTERSAPFLPESKFAASRSPAYPLDSKNPKLKSVKVPDSLRAESGDVWRDESGKPMSAFRRKRFMQQGYANSPFMADSSGASRAKAMAMTKGKEHDQEGNCAMQPSSKVEARLTAPIQRDVTRDPGGGVDPEAMLAALKDSMDSSQTSPRAPFLKSTDSADTSVRASAAEVPGGAEADMLRSLFKENAAKVAGMSGKEVQMELQSLEKTFGKELLERFRERKSRKDQAAVDQGAASNDLMEKDASRQSFAPLVARVGSTQTASTIEGAYRSQPESARPLEVSAAPQANEDQTHHDGHPHHHANIPNASPSEPRFTLDGLELLPGSSRLASAEAAGEALTIDSILQLCRSTAAAQRRLFFCVLARVLERHPPQLELPVKAELSKTSNQDAAWRVLVTKEVHSRVAILAAWMLGDAARNIREHVLECLVRSLEYLPCALAAQSNSNVECKAKAKISKEAEVIQELLGLGIVSKLDALLGDLRLSRRVPPQDSNTQEQTFKVIKWLCEYGLQGSEAVLQEKHLIGRIISHIDRPWPLIEDADHLPQPSTQTDAPSLEGLRALDALIRASRRSAEVLASNQRLISTLIRFINIQPELPPSANQHGNSILQLSLQILASLGRYGLATWLAALLWNTLSRLMAMLQTANEQSSEGAQLDSLEAACFNLLHVWTVCATDPHASTPGGHDIVWDTVKDWPRFSLLVLLRHAKRQSSLSRGATQTVSAAASHLASALRGARRHPEASLTFSLSGADKDEIAKLLEQASSAALVVLHQLCVDQIFNSVAALTLADTAASAFDASFGLTRLLDSSGRQIEADSALAAESLAWLARRTSQLGIFTAIRHSIIRFVREESRINRSKPSIGLRLLAKLCPNEEAVARQIIDQVLSISAQKDIIQPFFKEALRNQSELPASLILGIEHPSEIATAYSSNARYLPIHHVQEDAEASEDFDPATGAQFWRCLGNRLPLRRDWPLLPLDELMHSGNSAVFNRPGALPAKWDYNEKDVVLATLSFAISCLQSFEEDVADGAPSAAELWLSIIKVFLLEGNDASSGAATGALTGRDLFRDPEVSAQLKNLCALASALETSEGDDIENATARVFGPDLPFFQLYSDLLGVYDAVSFGDATFALAVVQPLAMRYSSDYRRLLWNDFAHILPTLKLERRNASPFERFCEPAETDVTVLELYAAALLSGQVKENRNDFLFAIAVHHISAAIWKEAPLQKSTFVQQLTKMMFAQERHREVARSVLEWECEENSLQKSERQQALSQILDN